MQRIRLLSSIGFLVLIFAGLASLVVHAVVKRENGIGEEWSWRTLVDGRFTAALGRSVDEAMPKSVTLNGWIDGLLYWTLGDAGPQVRVGCDGWLYLSEELVETPHGDAHLAQRVKLAGAIAAELARKGARLVIVPVPDKALAATEGLCGLKASAQARHRFDMWKQQSASLGLTQVDIGKSWPSPGYWRTDTHWDQKGAHYAAGRVSDAIKEMLGPGSVDMELKVLPEQRDRVGDLTTLAGLARTAALFGPAPDREYPVDLKIKRSGGLLDEVPAPDALLVGSSYSLNSYFYEYLQAATSREIVQKSLAGGGFAGAMLDVLENNPGVLEQVRLVVWEWPVRTLTLPLSAQEKKFLADHE